jgi:hypothetical protein
LAVQNPCPTQLIKQPSALAAPSPVQVLPPMVLSSWRVLSTVADFLSALTAATAWPACV